MTTSTRRPPPMEVYQDPDASFASNTDHDVEAALLNALGPLSDASNRANVQLNPTIASRPGSSPRKTDSSPLRPITSHGLLDLKIPPPHQPNFQTDELTKNSNFYPLYEQQAPRPETALFTQFPSAPPYDQENAYDASSFGTLMPAVPYGDPDYGYKGPMKRTMTDTAPLRDRSNSKRQRTDEDEPFDLPDPSEMPNVTDDGSKPAHSYAELIGMAILRAPYRRLTLAQIYKWISDNFAFYRLSETGWQNSIRHNLSLNKNFIKQERPKDDPGKGNYWAIKPGQERPYLNGKKNPLRRITNPDGSQYMHGLPHEMAGMRPSTAPAIGQFTLAPNPVKKAETKAIDSAKFPDEADLSSDGTIPASDPALGEDESHETGAMLPPPAPMRSSPPPADFGSSPPAMASSQRKGTPPPVPRFPSTSRSGGRRQKFAGLNDSGYWSSIESSAARGAAHLLTSEADASRPRVKKGRAELEIARIRSSSIDSPSKDGPRYKAPTSSYESSSPIRKDDNPLTPAVVFKKPARPPPSVSPNTNLKIHRNRMQQLLGSPVKAISPLPEASHWSPAFNMAEDGSVGLTPFISPYKASKTPWKPFADTPGNNANHLFNSAFDVFIDAPAEDDLIARGSPEKRSARRPSLARAATSTGILADITGTAKSNSLTLAPTSNSPFSLSPFFTKPGSLRSPAHIGSPLKQSHLAPTSAANAALNWRDFGLGAENALPTIHEAQDDATELFGVEIPSDGSEEAIDIFQDFGKIGQTQPDRSTGSPVKRSMAPPPRPSLDRRNTSRW